MKNPIKKYIQFAKASHKPININTVVLEYNETHIEVNLVNNQLTYKHVISPTRGGEYFSEGYFDDYNIDINDVVLSQIKERLQECVSKLPFDAELDLLPPGASRKAYMRYVDIKGNNYYYSTEHTSKSDFSVDSVPIHKEFMNLYELLLSQCEFSKSKNDASGESILLNNLDSRYFQETLWLCKNCGFGNLFENRVCINCGKNREW